MLDMCQYLNEQNTSPVHRYLLVGGLETISGKDWTD